MHLLLPITASRCFCHRRSRFSPLLPPQSLILSTSMTPRSQKLERIADELYPSTGLNNSAPDLSDLDSSVVAQQAGAGAEFKAAEKTVFDVKLEKFNAAAKITVIKEVRSFTELELGLNEAKDLVEKAPIVVKNGVSKEEGESIIEKLKALLWYWE